MTDLTWLEQLGFSSDKAEAKYSRSPIQWKLPQWKLNVKKTQCGGSEEKPSLLETGSKNKLIRELTGLSLRIQKTSSWGRRSSPLWLEGRMANAILIPLQSLVSLNPLQTGKQQGVELRDSKEDSPVCEGPTILCVSSGRCPSGWGFFCP